MTATIATFLLAAAASAATYEAPADFPNAFKCSYGSGKYYAACTSHTTGDPDSCVASCQDRTFQWGGSPGFVRGRAPSRKECIGPEAQCRFSCDEAGLRAALAPQPGRKRLLIASPSCTSIPITNSIVIQGNGRGDDLWFDARTLTLEPCGIMSPGNYEVGSPALLIIDSFDVRVLGLSVDTTLLDGVLDPKEGKRFSTGVHVYRSVNIDLNGLTVTRQWEEVPGSGMCGPEFPEPLTCLGPIDSADTAAMPLGPMGKGSERGIGVTDSRDVSVRNSLVQGMWANGLGVGGETDSVAILGNMLIDNVCAFDGAPASNGRNFTVDATNVEFAGNYVNGSFGPLSEAGVFGTKQGGTICDRARAGFLSRRTEFHDNVIVDSRSNGVQIYQGIREISVHHNLFAGNTQRALVIAAADSVTANANDYDIYEYDASRPGEETTNCHGCFGDDRRSTVIRADAYGGDAPSTSLQTCCGIHYPPLDLVLRGSDATLVDLPIRGAGITGRVSLRGQVDIDVPGETCGDDFVDSDETCDDGDLNGTLDACRTYCSGATVCGDGVAQGAEVCDKGLGDTGDGCNDMCQLVDLDDSNPNDPDCRP